MIEHAIVTRDKWLEARRDLLAAEKDLIKRSDQVAQLRRRLPWVRIDKAYTFDGPDGSQSLADLFDGRSQLVVQHFMLKPGAEQGCSSCSFMADHTDGMMPHLTHRDVTFVAISRAPLAQIERFRRRMGWQFKWLSSNATSFNYDFGVSFTPEEIAKGGLPHNYGTWRSGSEELPGISVFVRDDAGEVFHTYSTYGRGVEAMMGTYRLLDLTPKGRDEPEVGHKMDWVRHHDRYESDGRAATAVDATCCSTRT